MAQDSMDSMEDNTGCRGDKCPLALFYEGRFYKDNYRKEMCLLFHFLFHIPSLSPLQINSP